MGNSLSIDSCCCCCQKTSDDTKEESPKKLTSSNSLYKRIDLDVLSTRISEILDKAKAKKGSKSAGKKKWKPLESEDVSQLKDFLFEFNYCAEDLEKTLNGYHGNELCGALQSLLVEVGQVHWVTLGLLLVGMTLQRFETISENQEKCMDVLDEMFRLCAYLKNIREMEPLREKMGDLFEKSMELVVEGTILCSSQNESSSFFRFLRAAGHRKQLEDIRKEVNKIHTHLMLQMSFYSVQNLNKRPIKLPREQLYPTHAVGIEEAVAQVTDLLELSSKKKVLMVLLHGFGGMGKTTVADAVFATIDNPDFVFSKVSLFQNIDTPPVLTRVQKDILDGLTSFGEYEEPKSSTEGQNTLSKVLKEKDSFLYIDNVLSREELRKLLPKNLGDCKRLRIMMTARDSTVADGLRIGTPNMHVYEVPSLQREASMALLSQSMNADAAASDCIDQDQLEYILKICKGVPLALEIVGCYIGNEHDKDLAFRIITEEYEKSGGESLGLAKVEFFAFAFDRIDEVYRDAFLDICAFFVERRWNVVGSILGERVLELLERRALIKRKHVVWDSSFYEVGLVDVHIHDFILEIGRKRCKGTRITSLPELRVLLSSNEEAFRGLKGVFLQEPLEEQIELLKGETLKVSAKQLDISSSSLRVFSTGCMDEFFAAIEISGTGTTAFHKLVFWDAPKAEPPFPVNACSELRDLDYSPAKAVTLSHLPKSLRQLTIHLGHIEDKSQPIQLYTGEGQVLPNIRSMTLRIEEVTDSMFVLPPKLLLSLKNIQELYIGDFGMEVLPDDFHHLEHLKNLWVERMRNLKQFPDSFGKCSSLRWLLIMDCPLLESLPKQIHKLPKLESLEVIRCQGFKKLPQRIGECNLLKIVSVEYCPEFEELPESFHKVPSLEALRVENCENFKHLPPNLGKLSTLQYLNLSGCKNLNQLCREFHFPSLKEVRLNGCIALQNEWLEELVKASSLQVVHIKDCPQLLIRWQEMKSVNTKIKLVY